MQKNRTIKTSKIKETPLFGFFLQKIEKEVLSKTTVLVGLSGGIDSMVLSFFLYHFFLQKKYPLQNLIFVHLNHNIRKESLSEAKKIQKRFSGCTLEYVIREKS